MGFELTTLVAICTDCTGSCKSNYHKITTTTVPLRDMRKYAKIMYTILRNKIYLLSPAVTLKIDVLARPFYNLQSWTMEAQN